MEIDVESEWIPPQDLSHACQAMLAKAIFEFRFFHVSSISRCVVSKLTSRIPTHTMRLVGEIEDDETAQRDSETINFNLVSYSKFPT